MNKRIFLLILIPFTGCTSPNMIMKSWVGHTENELYRQWGAPSKVIDSGRNGKIVVYVPDSNNKGGVRQRYVNAGKPAEYLSPRNNKYKKIKSFYITPMGNIYAWKWETGHQ